MKDFILNNLTDSGSLDLRIILLNNAVVLVMAFFLMLVYKFTYTGPAYSRKFNSSIGMITIITTMIMSVISNNIALSLGMVGALSIIRFRTAVKEVRDAAFVFWGIAVGIGCGVSQYTLVAIGSVTLFLFMLLTRQTVSDNRRLLVISGLPAIQNKIEGEMDRFFGSAAHLSMKNITESRCEFVYSIAEGRLTKATKQNKTDISQKLFQIEGVTNVNLVEQLDDVGR